MALPPPTCRVCGKEIPWGGRGRRPVRHPQCSDGGKAARQARSYVKTLPPEEAQKAIEEMGRASGVIRDPTNETKPNREVDALILAVGMQATQSRDPKRAAAMFMPDRSPEYIDDIVNTALKDHAQIIEGSVRGTVQIVHSAVNLMGARILALGATMPTHQIAPAIKALVSAMKELNGGGFAASYSDIELTLELPDGSTFSTKGRPNNEKGSTNQGILQENERGESPHA